MKPTVQVSLFVSFCLFRFSASALRHFLSLNKYKLLIRGHECVSRGAFFSCNGGCLTLFSATNYCNRFGNDGAAAQLYIHPNTGNLVLHTLVSCLLCLLLPAATDCLSLLLLLLQETALCLVAATAAAAAAAGTALCLVAVAAAAAGAALRPGRKRRGRGDILLHGR